MEEKEQPSNIFDEATRGKSKKKIIKKIIRKKIIKKKPKEVSETPAWSEGSVSYLKSRQYIKPPTKVDPEVETMLNKIYDMREDIENKMDTVYDKSGFTQVQVTEYLEDPKNFRPEQWEKVQEDKKELAAKAWEIVGIEHKKLRVKKKRKRQIKRRRGKTIGGRRKNWISMQ